MNRILIGAAKLLVRLAIVVDDRVMTKHDAAGRDEDLSATVAVKIDIFGKRHVWLDLKAFRPSTSRRS